MLGFCAMLWTPLNVGERPWKRRSTDFLSATFRHRRYAEMLLTPRSSAALA